MPYYELGEFIRRTGILAENSNFFKVFHSEIKPDTVINRLKLIWTNDQLIQELDFDFAILVIGKNTLSIRPFIISNIYTEFAACLGLIEKPILESSLIEEDEKRAIRLYLIYFICYYIYHLKLQVDREYLKSMINIKYSFAKSHPIIRQV